MDPREVELDEGRREAGKAYLIALKALGLNPEGLFWAWDREDDGWIMMLVTRYFDIVGPDALSTLLFKAHNAAATPAEIDPFIVHIHSPDHAMIRHMIGSLDSFKANVIDKGRLAKGDGMTKGVLDMITVFVPLREVYVLKDVRQPGIDLLRKWGFIEKKVDNLAA